MLAVGHPTRIPDAPVRLWLHHHAHRTVFEDRDPVVHPDGDAAIGRDRHGSEDGSFRLGCGPKHHSAPGVDIDREELALSKRQQGLVVGHEDGAPHIVHVLHDFSGGIFQAPNPQSQALRCRGTDVAAPRQRPAVWRYGHPFEADLKLGGRQREPGHVGTDNVVRWSERAPGDSTKDSAGDQCDGDRHQASASPGQRRRYGVRRSRA